MHYFLKKLHSFSGFFIIGAFLLFHFVSPGINIFKKGFLIEFTFFSLPLIFHSLYGLYIVYEGNVQFYNFAKNWRYILQRFTGVVIMLFMPLHIYVSEFRTDLIANHVYQLAMIVGILAVNYHLANGLFGLLIHFGVTIGPRAQGAVAVLTVFLFFILSVLSMNALSLIMGHFPFSSLIYKSLF